MILRNDNAEERLTPIGYELGLINEESYRKVTESIKAVEQEILKLTNYIIRPNKQNLAILESLASSRINKPITMAQLLARTEIKYEHTEEFGYRSSINPRYIVALEIRLKYAEFIKKLKRRIQHVNELDSMILDDDFKFTTINGLNSDVRQKLNELHPHSIGQISRLKGFKTSDLAILIHHYKQEVLR